MADTKATALTETTSIDGTELLYVVEDPTGTPASRKATVANVVRKYQMGILVAIGQLGCVMP